MTEQEAAAERRSELAQRLRALLAGEGSVREVSMFGGRAFMLDDAMVASASRGGDLLVRVTVSLDDELLSEPGATRAEMGTGRSMGPGWITVSAESIADDARLLFWIDVALDRHRSIAGTPP